VSDESSVPEKDAQPVPLQSQHESESTISEKDSRKQRLDIWSTSIEAIFARLFDIMRPLSRQRADCSVNPYLHQEFREHLQSLVLWTAYEESLHQTLLAAVERGRFPKAVLIVIRRCLIDSSRLTPIQNRLIDANIRRRNYFTYCKDLLEPLDEHGEAVGRIGEGAMKEWAKSQVVPREESPLTDEKTMMLPTAGAPSDYPSEGSPIIMTAMTFLTSDACDAWMSDYPPPPIVDVNSHPSTCPLCCIPLPTELVEVASRWR
jgi:hypothetical protein